MVFTAVTGSAEYSFEAVGYDTRVFEIRGVVVNRSLESQANGCFVCGPDNPIGLKLRFQMDGDVCRSEFMADKRHAGYRDVTHGGIVFSLLDDVMANWLWLQGVQCFTAKADIRYRAQLPIGVAVRLEGRCLKRKGRLALMEGRVIRSDTNETVAEATGSFMTA